MTNFTKKNNIIHDPFDDKNFTLLFDELYVPLCQYCLRLVNDPATAEDIVQEQFIYFWENRKRLDSISSPSAYLYKLVKNKSLNYLYRQMRSNKITSLDELKETPSDQLLPSVNDLLENKELSNLIEKALEDLPLKCRTIFTMKRFVEMSNKEIAENLNISIKTVEAQMTIALKKITAFLSSKWYLFMLIVFHKFLQ